ncbi:hypothetical protein J132_01029 [Termitomyces sp. J132]|nr:hypothetical protein H2248_011834 [Termitomyces sp. 'cryptogamus']KNZ78376.1 hypothetical protein J132_01029 [Termitomyces sp. J132]
MSAAGCKSYGSCEDEAWDQREKDAWSTVLVNRVKVTQRHASKCLDFTRALLKGVIRGVEIYSRDRDGDSRVNPDQLTCLDF